MECCGKEGGENMSEWVPPSGRSCLDIVYILWTVTGEYRMGSVILADKGHLLLGCGGK
jgi:hypothetical protein